jgi:ABC-2 type transport system permease protein
LGTFFYSWTGYVVIAVSVFLMGLSFVSILDKLQGEAMPVPVTEIFLSLCFWLILLFSAPIITMRLFAQEKYSGTFETLMTAPVGDLEVVLAKFVAALVFYMVMWVPLVACIFLLRSFSRGGGLADTGTLGSTFLGIFLLGTVYMAVGCFASALTRSQIVAAMTSMAIGGGLFLASFLGDQLSSKPTWAAAALNCMAMRQHIEDFGRGAVDTRCIVYYLSVSLFFLFLTYRVVESRRWK